MRRQKISKNTACTIIVGYIIAGGEIADHYTLGTGCVNEFSIAYVNTYMGDACFIGVLEKYQITGL